MKIIVRPKHQRGRWFRDLTAAMLFAELARRVQGEKWGVVEVHILDGRSPHFLATYGIVAGTRAAPVFGWNWMYKKGF